MPCCFVRGLSPRRCPATNVIVADRASHHKEAVMLNLRVVEIAAEPRVLDVALAEALGFERPRVIRELIERNRPELQTFGNLPYRTAKLAGRGRPTTECHLNEAQALLVCMFARTPNAAIVRKQVIEVFIAWRQGKTVHVVEHRRRPPGAPPLIGISGRQEFFDIQHEEPDAWATIRASMPSGIAYRLCQLWLDSLT